MVTKFKNQLAKSNLAKNTVSSYVWTVNQQVPRVYKTGETKSEVRKSTAKELFGKCNQRCRLQISQSPT